MITCQSATPPAFVTRILLSDLLGAVRDYYMYKRLSMPEALQEMIPTVEDALKSNDTAYILFIYALFSMAVEVYILDGKK